MSCVDAIANIGGVKSRKTWALGYVLAAWGSWMGEVYLC